MAVAVEVGLINVGVGVYVLVGGWIVEVDVGAGVDVDVYAVSVGVFVSVGRIAGTLGGISIPVKKRLVALIPIKSPIDRCLTSARLIMLLIATIKFRKGSPIE